jgi:hypothetical protein
MFQDFLYNKRRLPPIEAYCEWLTSDTLRTSFSSLWTKCSSLTSFSDGCFSSHYLVLQPNRSRSWIPDHPQPPRHVRWQHVLFCIVPSLWQHLHGRPRRDIPRWKALTIFGDMHLSTKIVALAHPVPTYNTIPWEVLDNMLAQRLVQVPHLCRAAHSHIMCKTHVENFYTWIAQITIPTSFGRIRICAVARASLLLCIRLRDACQAEAEEIVMHLSQSRALLRSILAKVIYQDTRKCLSMARIVLNENKTTNRQVQLAQFLWLLAIY